MQEHYRSRIVAPRPSMSETSVNSNNVYSILQPQDNPPTCYPTPGNKVANEPARNALVPIFYSLANNYTIPTDPRLVSRTSERRDTRFLPDMVFLFLEYLETPHHND